MDCDQSVPQDCNAGHHHHNRHAHQHHIHSHPNQQAYQTWTNSPSYTSSTSSTFGNADMYTYPASYSYPMGRGPQGQPLVSAVPWPSSLISQNYYPPNSSFPQSSQPSSQPVQAPAAQTASTNPHQPTPRRTLTDTDRRRMCEYHIAHPNKKQTEIGEHFGVERSTVSKVLRYKEKYLNQEDVMRSPTKKTKSKGPNVEQALSTWVKNQLAHKKGMPSDFEILKQLNIMCTMGGQPADLLAHMQNPGYVDNFKRRFGLLAESRPAKKRSGNMKSGQDDTSPRLKRMRSSASFSGTHAEEESPIQPPVPPLDGSPACLQHQHHQQSQLPYRGSEYEQHPVMSNGLNAAASTSSTPVMSPHLVGAQNGPLTSSFYPVNPITHRSRSQTYPSAVDPYMSPAPTLQDSTSLNSSHHMSDIGTRSHLLSGTSANSYGPVLDTQYYLTTSPQSHSPRFQQQSISHDQQVTTLKRTASPAESLPTPVSPSQESLLTAPNFADARRGLETTWTFLKQQRDHAPNLVNDSEFNIVSRLVERWRTEQVKILNYEVSDHADLAHVDADRGLPGGLHHVGKQGFAMRS